MASRASPRAPHCGMSPSPASRVHALPWPDIEHALASSGCALTGPLFSEAECAHLAALYEQEPPFRSRVVMQRHGFGQGEYKYFGYPLPPMLSAWREALYERLAPLANAWAPALGVATPYPLRHADYLARCHAAGQTRP